MYGFSNIILPFYENFEIDINELSYHYNDYIEKLEALINFVEINNFKYTFLELSKIYANINYNDLSEIFGIVGLELNETIYSELHDKIKFYNPVDKNKYVLNLKELKDSFKDQKFILPEFKNCLYTNRYR